jgi:hypothetical protein
MKAIHKGLVTRAFQTIALTVLLVAGAAPNAMAAGSFALAEKTHDPAAREATDAAGISSKEVRPADA